MTMYLNFTEDQAERKIPMTMQDWVGMNDAATRAWHIGPALKLAKK